MAAEPKLGSRADGDYYDLFPLEKDRLGILIADVSGHGAAAAVVTGKVDVRGLAPAERLPADEQIDAGIDDEEMLSDDESELV